MSSLGFTSGKAHDGGRQRGGRTERIRSLSATTFCDRFGGSGVSAAEIDSLCHFAQGCVIRSGIGENYSLPQAHSISAKTPTCGEGSDPPFESRAEKAYITWSLSPSRTSIAQGRGQELQRDAQDRVHPHVRVGRPSNSRERITDHIEPPTMLGGHTLRYVSPLTFGIAAAGIM